ncbi:hypothetical protein ATO12_06665 [Aquimarina atlantica]|uniref:Bacteriocin n=1 Tax=Aquimarina atlantica TaxID=1317122 RepID=A0A023BNK8_9FLAO|nr:hypothetical protein [Aquimarina atlantica]EZH71637.1 hypothetical protein ATO12_06665 [Aquimarina atlantica]
MLKNILNLSGAHKLSKNEQQSVYGGRHIGNCPTYPPERCAFCGGGSLPNGCCLGSPLVHQCLNDF